MVRNQRGGFCRACHVLFHENCVLQLGRYPQCQYLCVSCAWRNNCQMKIMYNSSSWRNNCQMKIMYNSSSSIYDCESCKEPIKNQLLFAEESLMVISSIFGSNIFGPCTLMVDHVDKIVNTFDSMFNIFEESLVYRNIEQLLGEHFKKIFRIELSINTDGTIVIMHYAMRHENLFASFKELANAFDVTLKKQPVNMLTQLLRLFISPLSDELDKS